VSEIQTTLEEGIAKIKQEEDALAAEVNTCQTTSTRHIKCILDGRAIIAMWWQQFVGSYKNMFFCKRALRKQGAFSKHLSKEP